MNNAPAALNLDEIQGVILRGFRSYRYIRHFIFTIADGAGARALCAKLVPGSGAPMGVTLAAKWPDWTKPPYCLNLGVTYRGLNKLIGDANYQTLVQDSNPLFGTFSVGADDRSTADYVGDNGKSSPLNWWKNGWQPPGEVPSNDVLDLLITLYTPTPAARETWADTLLSMIPAGGSGAPSVAIKFLLDCDPLDPPDSIHFSYVDGISQPRVAGAPPSFPPDQPDDRPIVPSQYFVIDHAKQAVDPFLDNGCFGAFRLLYQDVGAFDAFLASAGQQAGVSPELIAAKMCGRWRDGTPLEVSPDKPNPSITGSQRVNFNYLSQTPNQVNPPSSPNFDTYAQRCPYASHTRRTDPRDDTGVSGNDPVSNIHRVMRRAFAFGPAFAADPGAYRGLAGLFMGASLTDQFEFLMHNWVTQGGFRYPNASPNAASDIDPLFGPTSEFVSNDFDYLPDTATLPPTSSDYTTTTGLTRFIRTDGGLYVFLPSKTALGLMAQGRITAA